MAPAKAPASWPNNSLSPTQGYGIENRSASHDNRDTRVTRGYRNTKGTLGELMASGEALMAKKVVGDGMIIQKNADAPAHPRPPAWTRKDLNAQWRAIDS